MLHLRKKTGLALLGLFLFISISKVSAQTLYESVQSGDWDDVNTWQSWSSGISGVGTAVYPITSVQGPTGTHKVLIRSGHTISMHAANRSCYGMVIEAGAKLWANQAAALRLQLATGGGTAPNQFLYPIDDTVQVDGTMGGPADGLYWEPGNNARTIKIMGSGTIQVQRLRMPGALTGAAANGGVVNFIIDANVDITQTGNYALSAVYNPAITNNYTITINSGKTVKLTAANGYFHNSQALATYGRYTYNILGTLDLSSNTSSGSNISANINAPGTGVDSRITINVDGGVLKLGNEFKLDTTLATGIESKGILAVNVINGGVIDATNTTKLTLGRTTDGAGGTYPLFFGLGETGSLKRTVGNTPTNFPIGIVGGTVRNQAGLLNAGTPDVFTVGISGNITPALPELNKDVTTLWKISEAVAGGSDVTLGVEWLTTDQGSSFSLPLARIHHHDGTNWGYYATLTGGTGTVDDPYVAGAAGVTTFSPFTVYSGGGTLPIIVPVKIISLKAYEKSSNIQVEWTNATELNVSKYIIEKSTDGTNFVAVANLAPATNNGGANKYAWVDANPGSGSNFYRIKTIETNNQVTFTTIVNVSLTGGIVDVNVYPNPVRDAKINVALQNLEKGAYNVNVINQLGQQVYSSRINHLGGSATQVIELPGTLQKGVYTIQLNNGTKRFNKSIVLQ